MRLIGLFPVRVYGGTHRAWPCTPLSCFGYCIDRAPGHLVDLLPGQHASQGGGRDGSSWHLRSTLSVVCVCDCASGLGVWVVDPPLPTASIPQTYGGWEGKMFQVPNWRPFSANRCCNGVSVKPCMSGRLHVRPGDESPNHHLPGLHALCSHMSCGSESWCAPCLQASTICAVHSAPGRADAHSEEDEPGMAASRTPHTCEAFRTWYGPGSRPILARAVANLPSPPDW